MLSPDHLHLLNGALVLCRRAVERLAVTAEDVLSAAERCNVIDVGLRDPDEPDVPCTVPQCGEEMSNALPDYVCDPMYGSTGIGGCFPKCTDELGSDSGTCNYCKGQNLYFDSTHLRLPQYFSETCTAASQREGEKGCGLFMDIAATHGIESDLMGVYNDELVNAWTYVGTATGVMRSFPGRPARAPARSALAHPLNRPCLARRRPRLPRRRRLQAVRPAHPPLVHCRGNRPEGGRGSDGHQPQHEAPERRQRRDEDRCHSRLGQRCCRCEPPPPPAPRPPITGPRSQLHRWGYRNARVPRQGLRRQVQRRG